MAGFGWSQNWALHLFKITWFYHRDEWWGDSQWFCRENKENSYDKEIKSLFWYALCKFSSRPCNQVYEKGKRIMDNG